MYSPPAPVVLFGLIFAACLAIGGCRSESSSLTEQTNISDGVPSTSSFPAANKTPISSQLQAARSGFAAPDSCAECHATEWKKWKTSDHAGAMAIATEHTVLADFNDVSFIHVGFDDVRHLTSDEIKAVLTTDTENEDSSSGDVETHGTFGAFWQLAMALKDAAGGVEEHLRAAMTAEQCTELDAEKQHLDKVGFARPVDIAGSHQFFVDKIHRLASEKKIDIGFGAKTTFYRDGEKFMVKTDGKTGAIETFEVKYTLGIRPLQQYMVQFSDGRIQCLPVAWDTVDKRYFHLYPKEQILSNDPLHWTGRYQNWNSNCADCHTTELQKNYDLTTNTFQTKWQELGVGCQSCHGPSQEHVDTARKNALTEKWKPNIPLGLAKLGEVTSSQHSDQCSACHARRRLLSDKPWNPDSPFLEQFAPELPLPPLYYADGQILEEDFEYSSFQQSRMFFRGVRCSDCHDSHSIALKYEGNRLCAQCHSPELYDTPSHHFHPVQEPAELPEVQTVLAADSSTHWRSRATLASQGTNCVDCHWPVAKYMVVDPRRDHSITKPKPELTIALGSPNACNGCHHDRAKGEDAVWARDWIDLWYGEKRKTAVGYTKQTAFADHYSFAMAESSREKKDTLRRLLDVAGNYNETEIRPITRAGALVTMARIPEATQTAKDTADRLAMLRHSLNDENGLVRLAAILGAEPLCTDLPQRVQLFSPLLSDTLRAVRVEAARVLAPVPSSQFDIESRKQFAAASQEYVQSLLATNESPESHFNLAIFYHDRAAAELTQRAATMMGGQLPPQEIASQTATAVREYREAIRLDPTYIPARVNLAMLHNERGEFLLAEEQFRAVLKIDSELAEIHYSLGLLMAEQNRLSEAIPCLEEAARRLPLEHRVHRNLRMAKEMLQSKRP